MEYVQDPSAWWKRPVHNDKVMLLQTMFEDKLTYNPNSGFGTVNLSLPAKVFYIQEEQNNNSGGDGGNRTRVRIMIDMQSTSLVRIV